MPRRAADNELIRAAQRQRILDAAEHVFARRGFSATRVSDVARRAGVSHGLVHHYFQTKTDLHRALLERIMGSADALPRAARAQPGSAWDRLRWYVGALLEGARLAPESFFLAIETTMNEAVDVSTRKLLLRSGRHATNLLAALVADGQAEGSVRPGDPKALAGHLLSLGQGLAVGPPAGGPDLDIVLGLLRSPRRSS